MIGTGFPARLNGIPIKQEIFRDLLSLCHYFPLSRKLRKNYQKNRRVQEGKSQNKTLMKNTQSRNCVDFPRGLFGQPKFYKSKIVVIL